MSALRKIVLWIGLHVPLGNLNPHLIGWGIRRKPIRDDEKNNTRRPP